MTWASCFEIQENGHGEKPVLRHPSIDGKTLAALCPAQGTLLFCHISLEPFPHSHPPSPLRLSTSFSFASLFMPWPTKPSFPGRRMAPVSCPGARFEGATRDAR